VRGFIQGTAEGRRLGYNRGRNDGYNQGSAEGRRRGYNRGRNDGYIQGRHDGYNEGYREGFATCENQRSSSLASSTARIETQHNASLHRRCCNHTCSRSFEYSEHPFSSREVGNVPAQESENEPQVQESPMVGDESQSDSVALSQENGYDSDGD